MTTQNLLVELFVEELPPKALKKLGSEAIFETHQIRAEWDMYGGLSTCVRLPRLLGDNGKRVLTEEVILNLVRDTLELPGLSVLRRYRETE